MFFFFSFSEFEVHTTMLDEAVLPAGINSSDIVISLFLNKGPYFASLLFLSVLPFLG
jgi:hypothetical protein